MSNPPSITCLGCIAADLVSQDRAAVVWGITSSGIFLHLASGRLIFLTFDHFRGPLTLNSDLSPSLLPSLNPGTALQIRSRTLFFDNPQLKITAQNAQIWSAPPRPAASPAALTARFERLASIHQIISPARLSTSPSPLSQPLDLTNAASIAAPLEKNLGLGAGLTPAGDDLAMGFLLALNRWGDRLCPGLDVPALNQSVCQAARRNTNSISADLIECASLAQADERLILALDGILTGQPDPDTCAAYLLSWGHTSGVYAFLGMQLANGLPNSPPSITMSPFHSRT